MEFVTVQIDTLFMTKTAEKPQMAKINTLFMTKTAEKPYILFWAVHTYIAHVRE